MNPSIWLHSSCNEISDETPRVRKALNEVGVDVRVLDSEQPSGPGVLVYTCVDEGLCKCVSNWHRLGDVRILAVQAGSEASEANSCWQLLNAGADDVLSWPRDAADEREVASTVAMRLRRWREIEETLDAPLVRNNLVGRSLVWRQALRRIAEVARSPDATTLVLGDTGTGKELAARLIHTLDSRSDKGELIVVDCTTLLPELSGSELFGHERGAFTGAVGPREGACALADKGTLFLDEIGELPLALQAQLLRVVQERNYKRVGGNVWFESHFRLICATNRNLEEEVALGHFRADLYYRIAHWICHLPPLRERSDDIPLLVERFLRDAYPGREPPAVQPPVLNYLRQREYRGNVRELRQLVARIASRHAGHAAISVGDVPEEERPLEVQHSADTVDAEFEQVIRRALSLGFGLKEIGTYAASTAIRVAIDEADGNLQRAARRLGVTDRALQLRRANYRH